ncbi:MAG: HipA N-terminal domain-containing protein [Opitutales bacterium]|nr:HipA N-terminal domain-containing protein [Opitutales bacterium]NRA28294.1 HipA N-terminal domain-containing protein [Opitutales bacterium]
MTPARVDMLIVRARVDGATHRIGRIGRNPRTGKIAFEPSRDLSDITAHTLSPFRIPEKSGGVLSAKHRDNAEMEAFGGLFGLFADSLPDTFGMAVCRQRLKAAGYETGVMELLAYQGCGGRGALSFEPVVGDEMSREVVDISDVYRVALRVNDEAVGSK